MSHVAVALGSQMLSRLHYARTLRLHTVDVFLLRGLLAYFVSSEGTDPNCVLCSF